MLLSVHAARRAATVVASLVMLSGCATNMKVAIRDPVPSAEAYRADAAAAPLTLVFKDERPETDKAAVLSGRIPMQLVSADQPFDPVPWVARHTVAELASRGLPVTLGEGPASGKSVLVKRLHIENHRSTGFSPFVTFTSLSADLMTDQGPRRIAAWIRRGKVPVWSFDEVIDPTYNDALALVTKEFASKLNQQLFGKMADDAKVNAAIAKIEGDGGNLPGSWLEVYGLGFSNNPLAIPELVKLTSHSSEYVRQAAISGLGNLKATGQFELLVRLHQKPDANWPDRAMALKAIGDLGTEQARSYLAQQYEALNGRTDNDARWTKELIGLYR